MKNLAIVPARSGSKGLHDKNIKKLDGIPLLAYSIYAAKNSKLFDTVMVSTDSEKYADIAKKYEADVPFLRSKENSGDNADSWQVVKEVLTYYYRRGIQFDTVCLLQPTSPLRTAKDIAGGYELLKKKNADAITSVCEVEHSPLWNMVLPEDGSLVEFRGNLQNLPRQKLEQYYRLNGALYIKKIKYENNRFELLDKKEYAYIMERDSSVDIDTIDDFEYASFLKQKDNRKNGK